MRFQVTILMLLLSYASCLAQPEIAFIVPERDLIPEGIAYDPTDRSFYLSSINKNKIIRIDAKGKIKDFVKSSQDGMLQSLGMTVDAEQRRLWVCNNSPEHDSIRIANIHVYDIKSGSLLKRYQLEGTQKHLFNDLVIAPSGDVFVTDSDAGAIYKISKKTDDLEVFVKPGTIFYPNGITLTPDASRLLVATGSELGIVSIDIESKRIVPIKHPRYLVVGIDGLYRHGNSLIGVQNVTFPEGVLKLSLSDDYSSLTSVRALVSNHPDLDAPTTGVIVGKWFYFIANTQLFQLIGNQGVIKEPETLSEIKIMRVRLD